MKTVLTIGQAAKLAGVSVQTLRHYGKLRLLLPSRITTAGHRRYSAGDCERLRVIRALREVGFDLDTIKQVLDRKLEPDEAVKLRLEALEAEQRALSRRRLVLRAAMKGKGKQVLERLQEKHVLAKLDRLEREAFLARHLGWTPRDTAGSAAIWRAATCDLPEVMDDAQLESWLELAEIAADERFRKTLERQFELGRVLNGSTTPHSGGSFERLLTHVVGTIRTEGDPDDEESRALLGAWLHDLARQCSRPADGAFVEWLLARFEAGRDARINRYWELIGKLKQVPYDPTYARAFDWLFDALRVRASLDA
jgi:DNA-binding transcriptional MerR regulator